MVWCIKTAKQLEFQEETVCSFLTRNNLSISACAIVKVFLKNSIYESEEILHLNSLLEICDKNSYFYVLTSPARTFSVYLNAFAKHILKAEESKITLYIPNTLSASLLLRTLQKYFPVFKHFECFSLYYREKAEDRTFLKQIPANENVANIGLAAYLQPINPFELSRRLPPVFTAEFYQLSALNSSTLFSKKYVVSIYGHFLFAYKKGASDTVGQSIEMSSDVVAYKQEVGSKTLAIIEQSGTRWSLYSKNIERIDTLLYHIRQTPKYFPREIELETAKSWKSKCSTVQNMISHNISSSSLPQASVLFPQDFPKISDELDQRKTPEFLIKKLKSHIQRSIWDNVNIEFIVYLLDLQGLPLATEIYQEIREFSAHRKRILGKLKEMEKTL